MTSLWLAGREPGTSATSTTLDDPTADVVVVGAGITGLITAVLLARAGKKVLVLEARTVGAGASGNTTAKISLLQGTKLSKIAAKHGNNLLRQYVEGNREGQAWVLRHSESHGLAVQHEDAYTYAQSTDGVASAREEFQAANEAGLGVQWADDAPVPFPFEGGVRLADQAQFDPVPFLQSLVVELESHGGRLVEGARVRSVALPGRKLRMQVQTGNRGDVTVSAEQLVLATGIPILDRGGFFARVKPQRSYCQAYTVPGDITRGMYISTDSPTRSVRYAPTAEGEVLIVGGAGHPVGREKSPSASLAELSRWTVLHYPGATQTHFWSAQDYSPADELPYVGPILPGSDSIFVATGFDKWGMTNGPAAALALAGRILGGNILWANAFTSWSPHELSGITTAIQANLEVGFNLAKGWITPITASTQPEPEQGGGLVSGPPWHLEARSAVDGETQTVSPVCPHLGGIVNWNDADQAWECPLHGSRFAPDGTRLEGPATRDLSRS
jgi:glycine/D-amino acid oxidase-like deaminating enzyme